jgi:outer membrane lipase/esterase
MEIPMKSSRKPLRTLLAAALALAAAPAIAQHSPFSQTFFFGDSMTDSGHFRPVLVQMLGPDGALLGRFTNNPSLVWAEYLADYYGTDAGSDNQGGTNYAVGGARAGVDSANALGAVPSVSTQVAAYLSASGGQADPDALYSVWAGANDLFAVQANPADAQAIIGGAIAAEVGAVGALQQAGARYVLVANMPDIGLTPAARAGGAAGMAQGTALATAYNDALFGTLAAQGLQVIPVDTFHFLQEVAADPGAYGLTNVTTPGCGVQPAPAGGNALFCNPGSFVSPEVATNWLFADGVHPSAAAHAMMAQLAISMIEGPRQMAVLPHAEAVIGRARAGRVDARLSAPPEADGWRWWTDLRGDSMRYGNGDHFDGVAPALTVGVDRASGNLVYGGFFGYGRQASDWGRRGGNFEQSDASLGAYLGWRSGRAWVNGQLGWSMLDIDTERNVVLGEALRTHAGSTDGTNLSAGASAGWDFGDGALVHGPVLGVLSQQIDIDGFAESAPVLSTSLAYPDQSVDSLIGSVGWQFRWSPADRIQPYGRVTWDREFEDAPEQAFASAQSIPAAMQYAVPGLSPDDEYGTFLVGARTRLLGLDADFGASATFGQAGGNDATVFVTVGNRF